MKLRSFRRAGAALLALVLACSLMTLPASAAAVTGVVIDPSRCYVEAGKTVQLMAVITMDDPSAPKPEAAWSSGNDSVASVEPSTGLVQGVKEGDVLIYAMVDGKVAACSVTVTGPQVDVTSVTMDKKNLNLTAGESETLTVTVLPEHATSKDVTFTSADPSIASVTPGGRVTGLKAGLTTVTATNERSGKSDYCIITVKDPPPPDLSGISLKLDKSGASIPLGGTITLKATITGVPEGVSAALRWESTNQGKIGYRFPNPSDTSTAEIYLNNSAALGNEATIVVSSEANPNISAVCAVRVVGALPSKVSSVEITTSPNNVGRNYVDPGSASTLRLQAVAYPASAPEEDRRIVWTSSDPSIATVDRNTGVVTGRSPGEAVIKATAQGDSEKFAERTVEVSGLLLSYLKKSSTGGQGTTVSLTAGTEVELYQYKDIVVTHKAFGNAQGKTINWESSNPTVAQVVNGRVTGNYPGSGVTITATAAGTTCQSSFKVRVIEDVADAITSNMGSSPSYPFSSLMSLLNARSQTKAGAPLDYVYNLKVSTRNGVLYYKYKTPSAPGHGVGGTERYYYQPSGQNQMALRDVSFVPLPGFDGAAVVEYSAMGTNGTSFSGTIRIEAAATGDVSYSTGTGEPVSFAAEHFSAICLSRNGRALSYVTFSQPSSTQGTLYYNYSPTGQFSQKVGTTTRYYATSSPSIDSVTFVPAEGYVGTVNISYRCVDSSGTSFSGTIAVRVGGSGGSGTSTGGNVDYYVSRNQQLTLNAEDFNNASLRLSGTDLDRIRFHSLPSSSAGTLYLNYGGSSSSRVSTSASYYRNGVPRISSITFVPVSGYNGTVSLPFTGTTTGGTTFSGRLVLHVGDASGNSVRYTTAVNRSVTLSAGDFNDVCRRVTGVTLNTVRFTSLPASSAGILYANYTGSSGTRVSVNMDYRRSGSPSLSSITFVPAEGYSGTVSIPFTGYDENGTSFSGTLVITVGSSGGGSVSSSSGVFYTGCSIPIDFQAGDFQRVCQALLGNPLSYVQFGATPSVGRFYQGYNASTRTGSVVNTVTHYGVQALGQLSYVPKAEYQGTVTIPYTMHDTQGGTASATLTIQLSNSYCDATFTDTVAGWDWAKPSIEYLRDCGITSGYRNNTYRPGQSISRGEFTLMICRAFQFSTSGASSFPDVPQNSTYAGAIASAQKLGVVQGDRGRFHPDQPITRQSAMTMICRALKAAGQPLPNADTGILFSYADGGRVSAYARPSVAALIEMGAVRGNSASRLNPGAAISRAEMAVILHRVLTR